MATKTVVCPECGTEAVPGRFACGDCGALLAAVGSVPLRWRTPEEVDSEGVGPGNGFVADLEPGPEASVTLDEADEPAAEAAVDPVPPPDDAPLAAAEPPPVAPVVPAILGLAEPPDDAVDEPDLVDESAPLAAASAIAAAPAAVAAAPAVVAAAPAAATAAPVWPPEGAERPMTRPAPRTPAGAYLSPAALAAPHGPAAAAPAPGPDHAAAARAAGTGPAEPDADHPPRASLAETLDAFGVTEDVPRRLIGAGAAIAGLGFLLPWASALAGNALGGSYWTRWGLAGPGHWIIVGALVALVLLALGSGRFNHVPVGPIAIVLAGVLIGVLWSYVFGASDRFVGVWLVLAGTIVLGIGGLLDVRRHDPGEPPV